tara:strand:- start:877 stop:1542 length:666 start_codon:yes stop_codon:yes gene_type:complete
MNVVDGIYYPKNAGKCWVYECLQKGKVWERTMVKKMRSIVKPNDTVIDCGANIGLHSFELSKIVGQGGDVYAFEAIPIIYDCLTRTVDEKELHNITTNNYGLYSEDDLDLIFKSDLSGRSGMYRKGKTFEHTFNVKSISLDTYFKDYHRPIKFIKIDVEGAEFEVLKGATDLINKHKPSIIVEVWKSPTKIQKLHKWLTQMNYTIAEKVNANDYLLVPKEN